MVDPRIEDLVRRLDDLRGVIATGDVNNITTYARKASLEVPRVEATFHELCLKYLATASLDITVIEYVDSLGLSCIGDPPAIFELGLDGSVAYAVSLLRAGRSDDALSIAERIPRVSFIELMLELALGLPLSYDTLSYTYGLWSAQEIISGREYKDELQELRRRLAEAQALIRGAGSERC